jgi:purine-nucleoside phosphorylase
MMTGVEEQIEKAVLFIQKQTTINPGIGLVLGTGMGKLAGQVEEASLIPYHQIPGFPPPTKENEETPLIIGRLVKKPVLIMPKRFHYYEGYTFQQISFPIRLMKRLGIQILILCNCAGGLNPFFLPGDLMVITDHINFMGTSPLIGPNPDQFGIRFPDMKDAYDPSLVALAQKVALEEGIPLQRGIYIAVSGPNLETPAETRFLRSTGADAVGMSTVPEVIVGIHAGLRVLGFSIIGNVNLPDAFKAIDYDEIVSVASRSESRLICLIEKILGQLEV